jgi:hypothetical protein
MPLQEQYTELPLTGGLDEKANKEGNVEGFLGLVNCEYIDKDSVRRRRGFTRVATWTQDNEQGLVASGDALAILSGTGLRPYTPTAGLGTVQTTYGFRHSSLGTVWDAKRVVSSDVAFSASYALVVQNILLEEATTNWASGTVTRQILWRVVERSTWTTVMSGVITGTGVGALHPRALASGGVSPKFMIVYLEGSYGVACTLKTVSLDVSTLTASAAVSQDAAALTLNYSVALDAVAVGGVAYIAYTKSAGNIALLALNITTGGGSTYNDTVSTTTGGSLAIVVHPVFDEVTVVFSSTTTRIDASVYPKALGSRTRGTTGGTPVYTGADLVSRVSASTSGTASHSVRVVAEGILSPSLMVFTYDSSSNAVAALPVLSKLKLATKPFLVGARVLVGATPSNAWSSGFGSVVVLDTSGAALYGQFAFDEVGIQSDSAGLVNAASAVTIDGTDGPFLTAVAVSEEATYAVGVIFPVCRVRIVKLDHSAGPPLPRAQLCGVGFVGGALPRAWDGTRILPASFPVAPEQPSVSASGTGLTGIYGYRLVLEEADARGNLQLSPPSLTTTITLTNQGTSVILSFPTAVWSVRNIRAKLYRTAASGSSFYLLRVFTVLADTHTVTDALADGNLTTSELLTATNDPGAELASELGPPLAALVAHRNRLFGIRSDNRRTIPFTKETTDPFLPQWNQVLTLEVDNTAGEPRALASMDDKVLIFQDSQVVAVNGFGPDATGSGSFSLPEVVARGTGVDDANRNSVVEFPGGVMFRGASGIVAIGRDLGLTPAGLPIQRVLGSDHKVGSSSTAVLAAKYLPSLEQVWFLLDPTTYSGDGGTSPVPVLVYSTRYGRWTTYTGPWSAARDVIEVAGQVYVLDADGNNTHAANLFKLNEVGDKADYADGVTPTYFKQTLKMPWFRSAGRNGTQRLWRVGLHGESLSTVNVVVKTYTQKTSELGKDGETPDNTYTFPGLGGTVPDGGFSLPLRVVGQRCSAFRCDIEITPVFSGSDLRLNAVSYLYGAEKGKGKAPMGRKPVAS